MKIEYFNYAAFALLALILYSAAFVRVGKRNGNRAFLIAVFEILLTTVFDIMSVHLDNIGAGNVTFKLIAHGGYLFFHTFSSLLYLTYVLSLTDSWKSFFRKKTKLILISIPAITYIVFFTAAFLGGPKIYYINELGTYIRGPLFFLNYLVAAFYLIYGIIYIGKFSKLFTTRWILTLFAPYPFIITATIIEFLHPKMIIEMFFNALALTFVFINIQRPETVVDSVTGCGNSHAFLSFLRKIYFNKRNIYMLSVRISNFTKLRTIIDVDSANKIKKNFSKLINDVMKSEGLKSDQFYCHQGYYHIFIDSDLDTIKKATEAIIEGISELDDANAMTIKPDCQFTISSLPDDFSDTSALIKFAYSDFRGIPHGSVSVISELMQDKSFRIALNVNSIISEAIEKDRLEVYLQPIYDAHTKSFHSAEALIRLKDPEYGFVPPDMFIEASERNGMISDIWKFVLSSVCSFFRDEKLDELGIDYIEVNLSPIQFRHKNLADGIINAITEAGISPEKIAVEVTETSLASDVSDTKEQLIKMSENGMILCLDDFGTGFSSTRQILDLPFSLIKLDKSFIDGWEDERVSSVVRDTLKMLEDINATTVAEGVEDKETLDMLLANGCDYIQGYYFSRPLPLGEFKEFIKNQKN